MTSETSETVARVVIYDGEETVGEYALAERPLTIGRDPANDIVLPDASVSRRHARIEPAGPFYRIRDLSSTNGTFVNNLLVRVHLLSPGDVIRAGRYLLHVAPRKLRTEPSTDVRVEELGSLAPLDRVLEAQAAESCERTLRLEGKGTALEMPMLLRLRALITAVTCARTEAYMFDRGLGKLLDCLRADRGAVLERCGADFAVRAVASRAVSSRDIMEDDPDPLVIAREHAEAALAERAVLLFANPRTGRPQSAMLAALRERGLRDLILYVERTRTLDRFDEEERVLFTIAADLFAGGLANARFVEAIDTERSKVRAVLSSLTDAVLVADDELRVTEANAAAQLFLSGRGPKNPIGQSLEALFAPFEVVPRPEVLFEEAAKYSVPFQLAETGEAGTIRAFEGRMQPFSTGEGRRSYVVTLRDATSYRRMEEVKREFIANLAHKLRNPLTVIQGNLALLLDAPPGDPVEEREALEAVSRHSTRLCELVEYFIEYADLELRSLGATRRPVPTAVGPLIEEIVASHRDEAARGGVTLAVGDLPEGGHVELYQARFAEAFRRVLENAVKFAGKGAAVTVRGERTDTALKVEVEDDGPGIPAGELENVFALGHQVDTQRTGEVPGVGLGLALARQVLRETGGDVRIESPPPGRERGTRVTLIVPLRPASRHGAAADETHTYDTLLFELTSEE